MAKISSIVVWSLEKALALIRDDLQPMAAQHSYHVTLAGGVLNAGFSTKDLDLVFLPRIDTTVDFDGLIRDLDARFGNREPLASDVTTSCYRDRFSYAKQGKRIDVFIV